MGVSKLKKSFFKLFKAYNDANSKLFLDSSLSDSAKGNGTPLTVTNSGVSLDGSNNLDFSSGDYLTIDKADINGAFAAGNEWFIDMWIYPTTSQTFATLLGANDNGAKSDITGLCVHGGNRLYIYYGSWITDGTFLSDADSITINTWQHIRVEKWLDGAQWKCTIFIDVSRKHIKIFKTFMPLVCTIRAQLLIAAKIRKRFSAAFKTVNNFLPISKCLAMLHAYLQFKIKEINYFDKINI